MFFSKGTQPTGVLALIDIIGEAFRKNVITDEFTPEPKGSFIVDSGTPQDLLKSLGEALNVGALVYVPDQDSDFVINSVKERDFDFLFISTSLLSTFNINEEINLSSLLTSSVGEKTSHMQKSLFNNA